MEKIQYHNFLRLAKYSIGGVSPNIFQLLLRNGPRKAASLIIPSGRMKDRICGKGLPLITVRDLLKRLQANQLFDCKLHPSHFGDISGDPRHTFPGYLIAVIAAAAKPLNALEIGTGRGGTTCQIAAQVARGGSVVTVDAPLEWSNPLLQTDSHELTEEHYIKKSTSKEKTYAWQGTPLEKKIQLIRGDSRFFDYSSLNRKFDFVFIDGSHSYDAVRRDTQSILPYLNEGAIVLWHDYQSSKLSHGVDKYLHEFRDQTEWPVHVIEYTTLAIQIRR